MLLGGEADVAIGADDEGDLVVDRDAVDAVDRLSGRWRLATNVEDTDTCDADPSSSPRSPHRAPTARLLFRAA